MPTIIQLKYIIALSNLGNFNKAAKYCNVSQPSLSSQIKKVEEELDIIIFDRNTKPIRPTKIGLEIINQSRNVLNESRKLLEIKKNSDSVTGDFHLACIHSLAPYILPLFVNSFSKKYPKVTLKISENKTDEILYGLFDNKIDAGLLVTPLYNKKIKEHKIFYEKFFVFTSANQLLYKKKYVTYSDLKSTSIWLLEEGHCLRNQVLNVCSINKNYKVIKNINFDSENLETIINLIRNGNGFTLLPELATLNLSPEEKKLNLKKFIYPMPTREVSLIHNQNFSKKNIISVLLKEILDKLPEKVKNIKKNKIDVIKI